VKGAAIIMATGLLSACVSAGNRPMPLAASGHVAVERAGKSYIADLQPSEAGPLLAVSRQSVAFGNAEGLEAKRVAEQFCATRGARVAPASFGHYVGGAWVFKGGCA
jgi:hypothetical protein